MFKLQSPSQCSFDAMFLLRCVSTAQNHVWTHWFLCLLVLLPFLFHLFHIGKTFPFEDFFHLGKQKKIAQGNIQWIRRVGHEGHAVLAQKLLNTQGPQAGVLVNHPAWTGQTYRESSKKFSLKLNAASHNNASWYTDTDGFLECSPNRGSLYYKGPTFQKIIPFWGFSLYDFNYMTFWKRQNYGDSFKNSVVARRSWEGGQIGKTQRSFRGMKPLCMILQWWVPAITHLWQHLE